MQEIFKQDAVETYYADEQFDFVAGQLHQIRQHYYDEMTERFVVEVVVLRRDTDK